MAARLPASQRTREELTALIEGRLSTASAKDELVKLASRLIVEEALEGEAGVLPPSSAVPCGSHSGSPDPAAHRVRSNLDPSVSDGILGASDRRAR
jgi:hypothetical protein